MSFIKTQRKTYLMLRLFTYFENKEKIKTKYEQTLRRIILHFLVTKL